MRTLKRAVLAALLLLLRAAPGLAQASCEEALQQAQSSYDLGLFEDVSAQLAPCFGGAKASRALLLQAHSLLAKAYLAADELGNAREEVSAILRLDPDFEPPSPPRFVQLVAEMRRKVSTIQVASVSKTKESLREAPATVVVVTAAEIERRGYLDLEQVLHDLPGFDLSRSNGETYSSIYQRGFRSLNSDRNLLLLDGVEQNDLSTNIAYLSRQYPLSSIERIEVIYGPESTIYGANAYTGVINIITKEPEALVAPDKRIGLTVQAAAGGRDARYADLTLAGRDRSGNLGWSLSGRFFRADEPDLSRFPDWDYNYADVDYQGGLRLEGKLAEAVCARGASPYYACTDEAGVPVAALTPEGERLVRQLDQRFLEENRFRFIDQTEDWMLYGKLRIANLTLGAEVWRTQEGTDSWRTEIAQASGATWTPKQTLLYLRYSRPAARNLAFTAFTRYQQSGIERANSHDLTLHTYASGRLGLWSLAPPCTHPGEEEEEQPPDQGCPNTPWIERETFGDSSTQIRSEISLVYEPSEKLSAVGGLDVWKSSIESGYDVVSNVGEEEIRPDHIEHTDVALYAQTSYRPRKTLKLVAAGRLNYNEINNQPGVSGYGTLFSPRLAAVYMPGDGHLVLKAIYSEAFKDPTDTEKLGIVPGIRELTNPRLRPEKVRNFELSAGWQPHRRLAVEGSLYQSDYSDIVTLRAVCTSEGCGQLQNGNEFRVRGLQVSGRYGLGRAEVYGNYTYADPVQKDPLDEDGNPLRDDDGRRIDELRVGDIAGHRLNLGIGVDWTQRLTTDLRLRYVGSRPTGRGTSVPTNPLDEVGGYSVAEAALSYKGLLPGTTLQLIVDNLFDELYHQPGASSEEAGIAPQVPQAGRMIYLRLITGLSRFAASGSKEAGAE